MAENNNGPRIVVEDGPGRGKHWCLTINNYTPEEDWRSAEQIPAEISYIVLGREVGENNTPHLQCYVAFRRVKRLTQVKRFFPRCHAELRRGTAQQAADYCKKDGDFFEHGDPPVEERARTDLRSFQEWCSSGDRTDGEAFQQFPNIYALYPAFVKKALLHYHPRAPEPQVEELYPWQETVLRIVEEPPSDRIIYFVVDYNGGAGKTTLVKIMKNRLSSFWCCRPGKAADMALMCPIPAPRTIVVDCPKSKTDVLQYSVLEEMKDGMLQSPKYHSCLIEFAVVPHVFVFMNQTPNRDMLSADRYRFIHPDGSIDEHPPSDNYT